MKRNANLQSAWDKVKYRGDWFEICRHYYVEAGTDAHYTTEALDRFNQQQAHNQYRVKHHIPFPDEIRRIREQYGLSAARMAEVLDFGINTYRQYELGEMPTPANAKLIRLADNPRTFRSMVEEKRNHFSENAYQKTLRRIEERTQKESYEALVNYLWNEDQQASEYTGFVKPNLEKVAQFVLYFAQEAKPLKTRMNKLLFYCDFLHFKRTGRSISGCNYRAIQYGPVPSHFHELFGLLQSRNFIRIEEELFEEEKADKVRIGERFVGAQEFNPTFFSEEELSTMQDIITAFEDVRTRELISRSHEEKGWVENKTERNLINYQMYAFDLKGI